MAIVPNKIAEALAWFESHETAWFNNASAIGLTSAQATAYQAAVADLRSKFDIAELKREEAIAATLVRNTSLDEVRELTATYIAIIKAYAASTANPDVYATALLPAPAPPTPAPAPTPPSVVTAELQANGHVALKWRATRRNGDFYVVMRRDNENQDFEQVGLTANKRFTDSAVPTGVGWVEYVVVALRGDLRSDDSPAAIVTFGTALQLAA